jgi:flagellar motility protein MotE (MotC chaperone)
MKELNEQEHTFLNKLKEIANYDERIKVLKKLKSLKQ